MEQQFHGEMKYDTHFIRSGSSIEEKYRRLHELELNGNQYLVLHREHDPFDDVYLFRVHQGQLSEIDDLQEWELVADRLDQQYFSM